MIHPARWLPAWVAGLTLLGCAGDGSRIPGDMTNGGGIQPTLASLQQNVFTPICTECHVPGGIGPMPLDSETATFQNLVNVASLEIPTLMRVLPGDPENSYVVWKTEGRPQILFDRMPPPPRPMLDADQLEALREWIRLGADP